MLDRNYNLKELYDKISTSHVANVYKKIICSSYHMIYQKVYMKICAADLGINRAKQFLLAEEYVSCAKKNSNYPYSEHNLARKIYFIDGTLFFTPFVIKLLAIITMGIISWPNTLVAALNLTFIAAAVLTFGSFLGISLLLPLQLPDEEQNQQPPNIAKVELLIWLFFFLTPVFIPHSFIITITLSILCYMSIKPMFLAELFTNDIIRIANIGQHITKDPACLLPVAKSELKSITDMTINKKDKQRLFLASCYFLLNTAIFFCRYNLSGLCLIVNPSATLAIKSATIVASISAPLISYNYKITEFFPADFSYTSWPE